MKPVLLTLLCLLAATPCMLAQGETPARQKVIKDPPEFNAYIAALNTQDPAQKAAAMEAFLKQYPQSIVKMDALQQALGAYQQAGNPAKLEHTARRILELDPGQIRALAIVTDLEHAKAIRGDGKAAAAAELTAQRGLLALPAWRQPEGMTEADFKRLRDQMAGIFNGAAGYAAIQAKDYSKARGYYLKSVELDSGNLEDNYQLGLADLQMNPIDLNGFWYLAKAIRLAEPQNNTAAGESIARYSKARYHRYHGGDEGWEQIVAAAGNQAAPPPGFAQSIKPAPTPAEVAVKAVQENDVAALSFGDWEYVLGYRDASPANKAAADKVWEGVQNKQEQGTAMLKIAVKVISATKSTIRAAITDDHRAANKADLQVTMERPMPHPPAPGTTIEIIGLITDYNINPFSFIMKRGRLAGVEVNR